jgi:hypothetical protein
MRKGRGLTIRNTCLVEKCRTYGARLLFARNPALPGWAEVWCRPSGPVSPTRLSHVIPLKLLQAGSFAWNDKFLWLESLWGAERRKTKVPKTQEAPASRKMRASMVWLGGEEGGL